MDGIAKYAISVLSYTNGSLEVVTIDRRYSEFDELAATIEAKLPSLQIRDLLPPKTFFRYVSASFLERRAAYLQMFLERVLRLNFSGVLDQEIPLTAEPNVRKFLRLPRVEWIVVPWSRQSPLIKTDPDPFHIRPNFSLSPTANSSELLSPLSPRYSPSSPKRIGNTGCTSKEPMTPREATSMEKAEVDELRQLAQRVCENVAAYVGAQLNGSLESMQLLETVLGNVNTKYTSMRREAKSIGKLSEVLEARATEMKEKMQIIDDIDEELAELEDMVDQLDQYTGSLEVKFHDVRT
ncbi:hypothetical protein PHYBOEH_003758 [Phytophthora boehmeriae]|uniref:PX domain-containing protein n=1 Tax=Phytophthora boehmeriae TaxID=109152 RepID=A0A8T1WN36_9STRA|nr:hypothetical protein PHYBOEH_003758 [Phytophthora boehmeriae]